jgi:hypothetical protein
LGRGRSSSRLAKWLEEEVGAPPPGTSSAAVKTATLRRDLISKFKNEVRVTSQACGLVSRAGVGRKMAQRTFRFPVGLGSLFWGGGKPVRTHRVLCDRPTQRRSRESSEAAALVSPMVEWRRGGRRPWASGERREEVNPDGRRPWPVRPNGGARGFRGPPGRVFVPGSGGARGLRLVMVCGVASMEEGQMLWPVAAGVSSVVKVAGVVARVRRLVLMTVPGMRRW